MIITWTKSPKEVLVYVYFVNNQPLKMRRKEPEHEKLYLQISVALLIENKKIGPTITKLQH